MPRAKKTVKRDPLYKTIEEGSGHLRADHKARNKRVKDEENEEEYLDSASTRKILEIAREQQREIDLEDEEEAQANFKSTNSITANRPTIQEAFEDSEFADSEDEADRQDYEDYNNLEDIPEDADPEDLEIFGRYVEEQRGSANSWADKIMAKVNELQHTGQANFNIDLGGGDDEMYEEEGVFLPPKVIEVYTQVGALLNRYRSGKLPRAFKIIPTLKNWRQVLYVTDPESWSHQAVFEATKLFITSMPTNQAHKFVRLVLLPRFREEIKNSKVVNYHIYRALKKALFKPQAFFKGLMFPLLQDMEPNNKEAQILGSVLSKTSIPVLHSAAALLHVAEFPYRTANAVIIKTLLDKKYALPYKVVDSVVFHFVNFRNYENPLPLIWHQSFLSFCQRYKNDITDDQRDALLAVARIHVHHLITPEVRRELLAGEPRMA